MAIIMDGNGRWAGRRGLLRSAGHIEGARTVRRIVEAAAAAAVGTLTLYAFSSDNWARPAREVAALLKLFNRYLLTETERCQQQQVRLNIIGRRDRLGPSLLRAVEHGERQTAHCTGMHLRMAVDYSARYSILQAAADAPIEPGATEDEFARFRSRLNAVNHSAPAPDVDLLIRTGGDQRLSDFLLWECAYAELYFTDCLWPDFAAADLGRALQDFARRQRRFGKVVEPLAAQAQAQT
ncbi:MAG TPA: polyprenyl diphosphate synthase [Steroidobacteraceae bacterium]|nr:polyprenyl diphosphate synthase [Steroidobacteraceae bacterium]